MSKYKSKSSFTKKITQTSPERHIKDRKKDLNPIYEINREDLPSKLYHGTWGEHSNRIMTEGLKPAIRENQFRFEHILEEEKTEIEKERFSQFGVFLTRSLSSAVWYSLLGIDNATEKDVHIFEVDVASIPEDVRFGNDGYGDLMTNNKPIPKGSFRLLNLGEIKRSLEQKGEIKNIHVNLAEVYSHQEE